MERLQPLAAAFLEAEDVDPAASLAIGSFAVFEGPAPAFEEFVDQIAGRLALIPRYRQKLHQPTWGLSAPAWVDDPDFDLRWHLRNTALPAPGGPEEISRLMSRVMSQRMDRSRPLWEYWFVEGLADGRWGLLSKLHHCLADGVSGTDLYRLVLDPTAEPQAPVEDTWQPAPEPSWVAATVAGATDVARAVVTAPARGLSVAVRTIRDPAPLLRATGQAAGGLLALAGAARPVHDSSLTGPLDGSRRYAWCDLDLGDIRVIRNAFGVTVNDVALAAVTGGFRRLLLERDEVPDAHTLRSLVPVSTREPGLESVPDNRVSLMLPYLPVDVADPVERLTVVRRRIRELRYRHEPEAGGVLTTAAGLVPFLPVAWWMRASMRLPQRQVATVTTNVPGPRQTLYALGREVQALLPYVPIADRVRIGVAMFSYRNTLTFGVTADWDTTPDLAVLLDGIAESAAELLRAAHLVAAVAPSGRGASPVA